VHLFTKEDITRVKWKKQKQKKICIGKSLLELKAHDSNAAREIL
jgi:hypothetical protein